MRGTAENPPGMVGDWSKRMRFFCGKRSTAEREHCRKNEANRNRVAGP